MARGISGLRFVVPKMVATNEYEEEQPSSERNGV